MKAWHHQAFAGVSFHTSKAKPKGGANDYGAIAQLVEHLHGMQGVRSSSLLGSILKSPVSDLAFWCLGVIAFLLV